MAVPFNGLLLYFVLLIHLQLQSTTCQIYSSQQGDGEAPDPGRYPGGGYPGPGPGEEYPGGPGGGGYPGPGGPGGGGMYPPGRPGPGGLRPGAMGPGPGSPPFGSAGGGEQLDPSFEEEEGEDDFDVPSIPDPRENPEWPNRGTGVDEGDWPSHSAESAPYYGLGFGTGPSIDEGTQHSQQDSSSRDHIDDSGVTGTDGNGPKEGTNSELKAGEQESVKNLPLPNMRQNMTISGETDDNFNYTGMYITVAICIAFMVTLVAIGLIRGPQGPFKTKRTDEEIAAGLNIGPTGGNVIMLSTSDGGTSPTDAQWEQKPLRAGECADAVTDVQVSCGDTVVTCEGFTTVAVTEITSKGEGV